MVEGACQSEVLRSACRRRGTGGALRGSRNTGVVRAKTLANAVVGTRHRSFPFYSAFRTMYSELHCHSAFSFLDGASLPEQLALAASQLGYPALALTDHHGLYGSMAFAQGSQKLGLQAITGAELTLLDGAHVTLLAETPAGYANLCR